MRPSPELNPFPFEDEDENPRFSWRNDCGKALVVFGIIAAAVFIIS